MHTIELPGPHGPGFLVHRPAYIMDPWADAAIPAARMLHAAW